MNRGSTSTPRAGRAEPGSRPAGWSFRRRSTRPLLPEGSGYSAEPVLPATHRSTTRGRPRSTGVPGATASAQDLRRLLRTEFGASGWQGARHSPPTIPRGAIEAALLCLSVSARDRASTTTTVAARAEPHRHHIATEARHDRNCSLVSPQQRHNVRFTGAARST